MTSHQSKNDRREQILDSALTLFIARGYEDSTVDEISKSAGLSKGSIYWYFKSKLEILFELNDRYVAERQAQVARMAAEDKYGTEALYKVHRDMEEEKQLNPEREMLLSQLMGLAARYPEIRERMCEYYRKWDDVTAGLIQGAVDNGLFRDVNAKALSQAICALYDGLRMRRQIDPSVDMITALETITKLAHDALTSHLPAIAKVKETV